MILLRTTSASAHVLAFAAELGAASDLPVRLLIDERRGAIETSWPKISLTDRTIRDLDLYVPEDWAWSCGDYGLYVARRRLPEVRQFWLIEHDVRITGDIAEFFALCAAHGDVDFLGLELRAALHDWWWYETLAAADARPYRCFFPVGRFSTAAIETLLAKRQQQSRRLLRRKIWPNDEAFVATTIANSPLRYADINDLGRTLYDRSTLSYDNVIDGDMLPESVGSIPRLHHPVLFGDDLLAKRQRLAAEEHGPNWAERAQRDLLSGLNAKRPW